MAQTGWQSIADTRKVEVSESDDARMEAVEPDEGRKDTIGKEEQDCWLLLHQNSNGQRIHNDCLRIVGSEGCRCACGPQGLYYS